ncbi:PEX-1N and AAA domain-containing protein [Phanerochaete sordida]|uniref:Peroxisomal ATPase PEX1 n=1 Tax=Phanerochaete sordida TaxID=48140 RepID=A0A9P3G6S3_9APHY|nr:PEX-1N and AAA domain-containing protein [Phanerochaete sordida]
MPRRAKIQYVSLRTSLVNLPISLYGPLLERGVRPQGLAVHLTQVTPGKKKDTSPDGTVRGEAYVGWSGMASASSLAQFQSGADKGLETVEIDPQFASGLGFTQGDIVEIGLLHDLGYATTVEAEPLTADDWEILELHAAHVEGTFLSQVRVAFIGQEIDVWVLGRTRIRLRVVSLTPSTSGKALLVTSGTELSIAPKTRGMANGTSVNGSSSKSKTGANRDTAVKTQLPAEPEKKRRRAHILRTLPTRVLSPCNPSCSSLEDGSVSAIAFVSKRLLSSLSDSPSDPPRSWRAAVTRIAGPQDPTQETNAPAASAPQVPRILMPTDPGASKATDPVLSGAPANQILVAWAPEIAVPDGHIVVYGSVADLAEWDQARVEFVEETGEEVTPGTPASGPSSQPHQYTQLAGVDSIIDDCKMFCIVSYMSHVNRPRVQGVPGLLVTGRSGAGKTSILRTAAKALQEDPRTLAYTMYVDLAKYTETPVSKVKSLLHYWFDKAFFHRPTVMVFDNMDKLMGAEQEHADSFRQRHISELFLDLFGSHTRFAAPNAKGIVLFASAESNASIHPRLNAAHVFKDVIALKPPNKDARRDILAQIVRGHLEGSDLVEDPEHPLNYTALATQTEGYLANDLKDLAARAVHRAAMRVAEHEDEKTFQPTLSADDFAAAQVDFVPLSLRDIKLQKSDIVWADIGGLAETKRVLRETLEWPTKYGPIFAQSPLRLRSGLLLYGFPGCGKTLLASAVARECGLNFISVKGPELLNKYIGASEQSVRELFERASAAKPCVLFFDEFDSIAPKRGHDSTGVTDRVVNQMLTQMDGAEGLDGVYVLAATSRPDLIDSALLRPGRLDKALLCNMPTAEERKEILTAVSRKVALASSVDLDALARDTDGFSGADLQALVYNAQLEVIHETISATSISTLAGSKKDEDDVPIEYTVIGGPDGGKAVKSRAEEAAFQRRLKRILAHGKEEVNKTGPDAAHAAPQKREIHDSHLRKVLQTTRPSVPSTERERLSRIYGAFVSDRSGELPVPPDAGGVGLRATLM